MFRRASSIVVQVFAIGLVSYFITASFAIAEEIPHALAPAPGDDSGAPAGVGLAESASKVYRQGPGVSIGGYGETIYQNYRSEREDGEASGQVDQWDFLRQVLYVGFKFDDRFLLNTEIEIEHASTGIGGEVSVEFAYVDWMLHPAANLRAGMVLVPVGIVNEVHEPTTFLGAKRPQVEQSVIPTTWRENGIGAYGELGPVEYRTYLMTGMDAGGFSASGIRGGRQKGSEAKAESFAWVGRVEHTQTPGLNLGISTYAGRAGQDLNAVSALRGQETQPVKVSLTIVEAHGEWRRRGVEARALGAVSWIGGTDELNRALDLSSSKAVAERQWGGYAQLGYDVLTQTSSEVALIPFVRYERLDTQDQVEQGFAANPANDRTIWTLGVVARPIPQIALKADFQKASNRADTGVDQLNVALGYIF